MFTKRSRVKQTKDRMFVIKRSGDHEPVYFDQITTRNEKFCEDLDIDPTLVSKKVIDSIYSGIHTSEIDVLSAETALYMSTHQPGYEVLAKRIAVSNLHKTTMRDFSKLSERLFELGQLNEDYYNFIKEHSEELNEIPKYERDYDFTYFGFKTLEKSYLAKDLNKTIIERPQHVWMRVATFLRMPDVEKIREVYNLLSLKYFIHASPTLFNAGKKVSQLSSCYLVSMKDDLYDMLTRVRDCGMISKWAGGIGINVSMIRSKDSRINGTGGDSSGIIPFLKLWNDLARYVNQGGKRKGAIAVYLEPHHPDVFDFLKIRKNNTKDEERCLDLHIALWISDMFMRRVKDDDYWCLFDPNKVKGLYDMYGEEFDKVYLKAEKDKLYDRRIKARELWKEILISQMETGEPYIMFKDHINRKNNQMNRGVIRGSNLCVSGDTMILCKDGYHNIKDKVNQSVHVWNGSEFSETIVNKTGENQKLLTIQFSNGCTLKCTPYHKFYIETSSRPSEKSIANVYEAQDLKIGMKLPRTYIDVCDDNDNSMKYPYTHGLFCADGTYFNTSETPQQYKFKKYQSTDFCKHHQDTINFHDNEYCSSNSYEDIPRISLYGIKEELLPYLDYRYTHDNKPLNVILPYDIDDKFFVPMNYSISSKVEWLSGLVDGDGCLTNNNESYSIQISSIHKDFLQDVFYMLQTIGVQSNIGLMKQKGTSSLPDGKGGKKHYQTKAVYRLCINNDSIIKLRELGFFPKRLDITLVQPSLYDTWRYTSITGILDEDTCEDTFCFNEPKEHKGVFNGILTGQCSEIVQYSDHENFAVCNLASISLPAYVKKESGGIYWTVYTKEGCSYCEKTLTLLDNNNEEYQTILCTSKNDLSKDHLNTLSKDHSTFPMIFLNEKGFVGGYNELKSMYSTMGIHTFDFEQLGKVTELITENMNIVIDKNFYPVPQTQKSNSEMRPTGIGIQGFADILQMMDLAWDDQEAKNLNADIYATIYYHALKKSMELAKEHGPYDYFNGSPASDGKLQYDLWNVENPTNVHGLLDWDWLKSQIKEHGLRNSLLITQMPTASSAQILGNNESFEPYTNNMYVRRVLSGDFPIINQHLYRKLDSLNLWTDDLVDNLIEKNGSVQEIDGIPQRIKNIYKTAWELPTRLMVDYAVSRGPYIDQTQSFNVFMENPDMGKLSSMFLYEWENGIKTGMYYLRRRPKVDAIKFTIMKDTTKRVYIEQEEEPEVCELCSA